MPDETAHLRIRHQTNHVTNLMMSTQLSPGHAAPRPRSWEWRPVMSEHEWERWKSRPSKRGPKHNCAGQTHARLAVVVPSFASSFKLPIILCRRCNRTNARKVCTRKDWLCIRREASHDRTLAARNPHDGRSKAPPTKLNSMKGAKSDGSDVDLRNSPSLATASARPRPSLLPPSTLR